jgi:ABC-type phosphate transport system substrate-binding protein
MENNTILQMSEFNKASIENLKEVFKSNIKSTTAMFKELLKPSPLAQMAKVSLDFSKEVNSFMTALTNVFMESQLSLILPQTSMTPFKNFGELYVKTITDLVQKQAELLKAMLELMEEQTESLKKVKNVEEAMTIFSNSSNKFQEILKIKMAEIMLIFSGANTSVNVLTDAALDEMITPSNS